MGTSCIILIFHSVTRCNPRKAHPTGESGTKRYPDFMKVSLVPLGVFGEPLAFLRPTLGSLGYALGDALGLPWGVFLDCDENWKSFSKQSRPK